MGAVHFWPIILFLQIVVVASTSTGLARYQHTQKLHSEELSYMYEMDLMHVLDASPLSTAADQLFPSETTLSVAEREIRHVYNVEHSFYKANEIIIQTTEKHARPILTIDHVQLLSSFSREPIVTEDTESPTLQTTPYTLTPNIIKLSTETPAVRYSFPDHPMIKNEQTITTQTTADFDNINAIGMISIESGLLSSNISPFYPISASLYFASSVVTATESPDSKRLTETADSSKITSKLDTNVCELFCTIGHFKVEMYCLSFIPCHIPKSVSSIVFIEPDYSELVDEYRLKSKNISLFGTITKVELRRYSTPQAHNSIGEFLMLFPLLRTIALAGERNIECYNGKIYRVTKSVMILCSSSSPSLVKLLDLACFPNLEEVIIKTERTMCLKSYNSKITRKWLQMSLSILSHYFFRLKYLIFRLTSQFTYLNGIALYESYPVECRYHRSLEKIIISFYGVWRFGISVSLQCECRSVIVIDKDTRSIPKSPHKISINFNFHGFQNVIFWFNTFSCISGASNKIYARIIFSFGSHLEIQRHCKNESLKMTVKDYNNKVMHTIFPLVFLERAFRAIENMDLSSLNSIFFLFLEGNDGRIDLVKKVILSNNQLGIMAKNQTYSFEKILYAFKNLEFINLAHNGIEEMPEKIFTKSHHLKTIVLSNNKIPILRIEQFRNLTNLLTLDLRNNRIKMINVFQLHAITSFLSSRNGTLINILGNIDALKCVCIDIAAFLSLSDFIDNETFLVSDHCEIDNGDIVHFSELESYCWRQTLILIQNCFLAIASGLIVVGLAIAVVVWRIRKSKRLIKRFVKNVKHGRAKKDFLLFLSYSSDDGEMVHRLILPEIAKRVLQRTGVDKDQICTGDTHFIPGYNIIQEAIRCIDLCSVVVFVMTKSFVRSPFCRMEVKEALDQAKPIILIIKEKTDPNKMPKIIRNIFYKYSRFHFIRGRHDVRVLPSWDLLVSAIFNLAANEERDLKCLEKLEQGDQDGALRKDDIEMHDIE